MCIRGVSYNLMIFFKTVVVVEATTEVIDEETIIEKVVHLVLIDIIMAEIVHAHTRHSGRDINVVVLMVGGIFIFIP